MSSSSSTSSSSSLLISPSALAKCDPSNLRIIDATWFMPNVQRDPFQDFKQGKRIKGASGFWSVDEVADKKHPMGLKHMMPDSQTFAEACGKLGISHKSKVVVYDTHGLFSAPRTLFTFKAFGHNEAYVLDGGLPRWLAEGLPTEEGDYQQPHQPCDYEVSAMDGDTIRSYEQIKANTELEQSAADLVLDARPAGRFTGEAPEPRPGLSSGHMPNSVSLPFSTLLTAPSSTEPSYQTLLPREELRSVLLKALGNDEAQLQAVLNGERKVTNSCGSGMTAAVIWLALQELSVKSAIYDESWTGYAMREGESKILKGSA